MCLTDRTPQQKLREYEETLEFIQAELQADREKLDQAKNANAASDIIELMQQNISKWETGVDRYQSWIKVLRTNMEDNES